MRLTNVQTLGLEYRASHEALGYVWVDTCCVDRSSSVELLKLSNPCFAGTDKPAGVTSIWKMCGPRRIIHCKTWKAADRSPHSTART
ncbi:hypothetical protein HYQ46_000051 [Verticillium longisporum]|nr:hypothetical protein HYQ44_000042 [Verticillium longisporum]KAG7150964.1 hypothetical protein HYQ46_000051 [Verticillium longisporum]